MSDVDLRQILEAFAEKGWNLYLETGPNGDDLDGPIDNIVGGVEYSIMPATDEPFKIDKLLKLNSQVVGQSLGPTYNADGTPARVYNFIACPHPEGGIARLSTRFPNSIDLPLADAAMLIRENMSAHRPEELGQYSRQEGQDGRT